MLFVDYDCTRRVDRTGEAGAAPRPRAGRDAAGMSNRMMSAYIECVLIGYQIGFNIKFGYLVYNTTVRSPAYAYSLALSPPLMAACHMLPTYRRPDSYHPILASRTSQLKGSSDSARVLSCLSSRPPLEAEAVSPIPPNRVDAIFIDRDTSKDKNVGDPSRPVDVKWPPDVGCTKRILQCKCKRD